MQFTYDVVTITLNPAIDRTLSIPNFKAGEVNRVGAVSQIAGGKGVNVASRLAEAGMRVGVTGFLGKENAEIFEELFTGKGIADHFVRCEGATREGIKIADSSCGQVTEINFPGLVVPLEKVEEFMTTLDTLTARWIVLAGSLPPGVEPGIYRALVERIRARGSRVAVDTSGEALAPAVEACPDLIKPNLHELEMLLGRRLGTEDSVLEAARGVCAKGVGTVVVSMGAQGAWFVRSGEALLARPPEVALVTTVGAGDAMVAGMILAESRALPLVESARLATACAALAVSRALPEAVAGLMKGVRVMRRTEGA